MAIPPRKPDKEPSDFDTSQLLAAHGEHEKTVVNLTERLTKIEGHLATPQALADFFKESAKDSRYLDGAFAEMFCRFMNENPAVRAAVGKRMEEIDRNFFFKTFKRLWLPIYSVILIVGTILLKAAVDWLLTLIPHH